MLGYETKKLHGSFTRGTLSNFNSSDVLISNLVNFVIRKAELSSLLQVYFFVFSVTDTHEDV